MSWEEQYLAKKEDGRLGTYPQVVGSASSDSELYSLLSGFLAIYGTPSGFQIDRNVIILDGGNYNHANIILNDSYQGDASAITASVFNFGGYIAIGDTNAAGSTVEDLSNINIEDGESLISVGADIPALVQQTASVPLITPLSFTQFVGAGAVLSPLLVIGVIYLLTRKKH